MRAAKIVWAGRGYVGAAEMRRARREPALRCRICRISIFVRLRLNLLRIQNTMRFSALIAAGVLSISAACAPAAAGPGEAPAPASGSVATAQRTWEARRPAAYAYDLALSCFCIHRGEYTVEVRNGSVASVRERANGAAVDGSRLIPTVDRLFEMIQEASRDGRPLRVEYDAQWGYPSEAEIGLLADDSGTLYTIQNLRAL